MLPMFSNAIKPAVLLGASAVLLTGCANLTADQSFYYDEEDSLVYDFSYKVNISHDDADILIGASSQTAGLLEGAESREDVCDSIFGAMKGEESISGSERVLPFVEDGLLSENELGYVETSFRDGSRSMDCTLTLKAVPVAESSTEGLLGGIDVWQDEEEGIIYAVLDGDGDGEETWIDRLQSIEGSNEVNARVLSSADFIFEFPGQVLAYDNGSLINQRDYDGSVDRTRLVNQDASSANIVHITAPEMIEENGFQIAAEDGSTAQWMQWLIYGASGLLLLVALWMILLFAKRQSKERKRKSPAKRALSDVHEITLDNPNPYKESRRESGGKSSTRRRSTDTTSSQRKRKPVQSDSSEKGMKNGEKRSPSRELNKGNSTPARSASLPAISTKPKSVSPSEDLGDSVEAKSDENRASFADFEHEPEDTKSRSSDIAPEENQPRADQKRSDVEISSDAFLKDDEEDFR